MKIAKENPDFADSLGIKIKEETEKKFEEVADQKMYLFCVENEREIFSCLKTLLNQNDFVLTCSQMINILIEKTGRSTIV